jgi:diguanylate cyclase (GGDEF)-like protein/PAS domain S-box-containing protein
MWLTRTADNIAVFWPANGVLLGLLLRLPVGDRLPTFGAAALGSMAANLAYGDGIGLSATLAATNLLEVACGLALLERLIGRPYELRGLPELLGLLVTSIAVPAASASLAAVALLNTFQAPLLEIWVAWWAANVVGLIIFLPLVVVADLKSSIRFFRNSSDRAVLLALVEYGVALAALLGIAWISIATSFGAPTLFAPVLLWMAVRRGVVPTAFVATVVCVGLVLGVKAGLWPWPPATTLPLGAAVARLQLVIVLMTVAPLMVAVVIAERERARLTEAKAKERLDDALAAMADGLALIDSEGLIALCNPRFKELLPRRADLRVPGVRIAGLLREATLHGEDGGADATDAEAWIAQHAIRTTDGPQEVELADGRWIEALARPTTDGGHVLVCRDVTERKRLELEVAEAKRWLETVISTAGDGIIVIDRRGTVRNFSPAAERVFGYESPEVVGRNVAMLMPEGERAAHDAYLARFRATGQPRIIGMNRAVEGCRQDGSLVPLEISVTQVAGSPDGLLVGVVRDVTKRKRLEADLAHAKQRLDDALEAMADGFVLFDAEDRLVLCNRRWLEFFPHSRDVRVPGARAADIWREAARRGDYKGVDLDHLNAWVESKLRLYRSGGSPETELADGRWLETRVGSTSTGERSVVVRDITDRKRLERQLEHQATHDTLTELPNRAMVQDELQRATARARRQGSQLAVMLVDLDQFKDVNDHHGHAAGDAVLAEVARRLEDAVRKGDLVGRLGGDEFAILAAGRPGSDDFSALARRIVRRLTDPLRLGDVDLRIGGTLGLTIFPADPGGPEELLLNADRALYAAKQVGRGTWAAYAEGMRGGTGGSAGLGAEVAAALERGELDLDFQPILALDTLETVGVEALVRWNHPERGRLPASAFISAAEHGAAGLSLTRFVLEEALRQQRGWREAGAGDLKIWVNLAPRCLASEGLVEMVAAALAERGADPGQLVLELTESTIAGVRTAEARLSALRLLGVGIAVDDFGTGHSSLGRLKALPIDVLKIDRTFVADVAADDRERAIVLTVVALGNNLGLATTAEGVETREQLKVLRRLGCALAQGHLFARPMAAAELADWLMAWRERRLVRPEDDLLREGA